DSTRTWKASGAPRGPAPTPPGGTRATDLLIQVQLAPEDRVHQVLLGQHGIQGRLIHEVLLQDQLPDGPAGLRGLLTDGIADVMAQERVEIGDDTDGVLHIGPAD